MCLYLVLGLPYVVMQGYDFGQVRGYDGHAGVIQKLVDLRGIHPSQHVVKRGDP